MLHTPLQSSSPAAQVQRTWVQLDHVHDERSYMWVDASQCDAWVVLPACVAEQGGQLHEGPAVQEQLSDHTAQGECILCGEAD